ncbi:[protein-PII] uridylyltransferase [Pelomicrobium methylotrophicum]|uniref:[protein-PII] uridylyltransferase n=1 Tax=Pelomicrobium methylotrophicum TaxID=2602750 RepID=UPI001969C38E|nr:[protein-PII] uridylyltransferase [Pelomicrobium methylotrophicum]
MSARANALAFPVQIADLKQRLATGRRTLQEAYPLRPRPAATLRRHARLVDGVLRELWRRLEVPPALALVAVGGYGRGELFPYSDVDVLVLLPAPAEAPLRQTLERLVGALWDVGLDTAHSVRTVDECLEQARKDITIETTLMEARLLAGSRTLFRRFRSALEATVDAQAFLRAKRLEQEQRHQRYHDASTNLEPNLKESPGGLRDLQMILWIAQACGLGRRWRDLVRNGLIAEEELRQLRRQEAKLQDLRIRLHYLAGRREDRLLFDFQTALARELGITDRGARRASELLMQRYYRAAKVVAQLNVILLLNLEARIDPRPPGEPHVLNDRFQVVNGLLMARDPNLFLERPSAILESFLLMQQHREIKGRDAETLRALWRAVGQVGGRLRRDPESPKLFMQILRQPTGITRELRRMNRYGVLGLYIPAFGRIVGQMQHDLYHVYTVDEHILMVVRNLRRFAVTEFAHEYPLCSRLMAEFERPEVLYLAALFHDIAKGRGGDHSALGALEARRFCRRHDLLPEDAELVAWLVQHHLVMSHTAQKQDLSDPEVIARFARLVATDRRLTALYLLTVADIRGTSPKVWNAWKAKLLEDLYLLTRRYLGGQMPAPASIIETRQGEALRLLRLAAVPEGVHKRLWSKLDVAYFLRHEPQEIAWHTRVLNYRVDTPTPVVKARLAPGAEGIQVLVYCADRPQLFARLCDCFARINFSIVEAKIYTTRHGYALDSFLVLDPENKPLSYRDLTSYIEYEVSQALDSAAPLGPPPSGRVSRQMKHFPIPPEVHLQADDYGRHHILSIVAGDRTGLLSRVARVLHAHGINVHSARITTLGERAEDTFLISGGRLGDDKAVVQLETDLLEALKT